MRDIDDILKYTSKLNLLYVEDDKSTREASLFLLENFFQNITTAVDGQDGINKFKESDIDLIITDINMPYLNGLEMIAQIKDISKDMKVIIFSANMEAKYFTESIRLGVNGYLIKPIEIDNLINILDNIVSDMRLRDEIKYRREMEEQNHKFLQAIVDASYDPIMVINRDYTVDFMSKSIRDKIDTLNIKDINNPKCYEILHNRDKECSQDSHPCPLKNIMQSKEPTTMTHKSIDKYGNITYMEIGATPLLDENDECIGVVEISRDITEHINAKERLIEEKNILAHKAHHDELTGLPNKSLFEGRLKQSIEKSKQNSTQFALFFIDLDKFKWVNDNIGHDAGDIVLQVVSRRVSEDLDKDDTFARIGGDEFTIIMEELSQREDTLKLAQRILKHIQKPIEYKGIEIEISASIGVAIYPNDSKIAQELIKYADIAMYKAKDGEDNIVYYEG